MANKQFINLKAIGARVRKSRRKRGIESLEKLADQLVEAGCRRPSTAKLSRIEAGIQPVTTDLLPSLSKITGIPAADLRPDLARLMRTEAAE